MFQQQQRNPQHRQLTRGLSLATAVAVSALALGTGAGPAAARQDAGPTAVRAGQDGKCVLKRVGTLYVLCDDNTGNGAPAPAWIPKR